jgi:effector-binding domain-containing protein
MQVKEVKPINFLFFRAETTVNQLVQFIPVAQELFKEAVRYNLAITGPIHWHYFGFEGDLSKTFTLEVSLPIGDIAKEYDGKFHFKRTESFKCVTTTHEGNWLDIPQSYERLMKFIHENRLSPLAINREVYVNTDFKNPEANITEIQIGVN